MLSSLPEEVVMCFLHMLDKNTLKMLALVSKQMQRLSEDASLWMDEIITPELIAKTGLSAKFLYQLKPLLEGNYLSKKNSSALSDFKEKLNGTKAQPLGQLNILVSYPFNYTINEIMRATMHNKVYCEGVSRPSFYNTKITLHKYQFDKRLIAYRWDAEGARLTNIYDSVIPRIHCVIIFADNQNSLIATCESIKAFYSAKQLRLPFIFVATLPHYELDLDAIDLPIEGKMYLPSPELKEAIDQPNHTFIEDFLQRIDAILKMKPATPMIKNKSSLPTEDRVNKKCLLM